MEDIDHDTLSLLRKSGIEMVEEDLIREVFKVRGNETENVRASIGRLKDQDLIDVRTTLSGARYMRLAFDGERRFWPRKKRMLYLITTHPIESATLVLSGAIFVLTSWSLFIKGS